MQTQSEMLAIVHAAPNGRPLSRCSRYSHGTRPEMLMPGIISVNQQMQKVDREQWVVGAMMHSPLTEEAENDKLASVVKHEYNKVGGKHSV